MGVSWFQRMKINWLQRRKRNKIYMVIDLENLLLSQDFPSIPEKSFSIITSFDDLIKQISQEIGGEIVDVSVFAPLHIASTYGEILYELGFFINLCPKIIDKAGAERDTTDSIIIETGIKRIQQIQDLTHLCIGSGDKDFTTLAREAIRRGLKIIVVASNLRSLSSDLINLADKKKDGTRMVYLFPPTREG